MLSKITTVVRRTHPRGSRRRTNFHDICGLQALLGVCRFHPIPPPPQPGGRQAHTPPCLAPPGAPDTPNAGVCVVSGPPPPECFGLLPGTGLNLEFPLPRPVDSSLAFPLPGSLLCACLCASTTSFVQLAKIELKQHSNGPMQHLKL